MTTEQRPVPPRIPVEYAPAPVAPVRRFYAAELLVLLVPFGVAVSIVVLFVIPQFEQIFMDFGTQLPGVTVVLLEANHLFRSVHAMVVFWVLLLLVPMVVAPLVERSRGGRWLVRAVIVTVMFLVVAFAVLALFAPMLALINAVSGKA